MNISELNIHIVGGTGLMGGQLRNYLESHGCRVTVSGKRDDPKKQLAGADIVFISVPISKAPDVITKVSKLVKPDCLLVDLSSVKTETTKVLKKTKLPAVAIHQLYGPTVTLLQNQKIIFLKIKHHQKVDVLERLFRDAGAQILYMKPKQHDTYMAHIQALTHFINITLAHTLLENQVGLGDKISTPVYLSQLATLSRVISQSPQLLTEFQLQNPYYPTILKNHLKYQLELYRMIAKKDYQHLIKNIQKIHKSIDPTLQKIHTKLVKSPLPKKVPKVRGKVAYLGPKGTFSHQATLLVAKEEHLVPSDTIYGVFELVASRRADFGIVPAENSTEGIIRETLDLLIDFDLKTNTSLELRIHQSLLSNEKNLSQIKTVISHPQALAQCRNWLKHNLPHANLETSTSTLTPIREQKGRSNVGFIGPSLAAEIYSLHILAKNIEDNPTNVTKFYIISKHPEPLGQPKKTLLFLTVFDRVGILRDILDVFASSNINLSMLESRPSRNKIWNYHFFVEVETVREDPRLLQSLNILKKYCPVIKVIGGV